MSGGKRSRDKGQRIEREIVNLHREIGVDAERVPLSGAAGGTFDGDIVIAGTFKAEVKARAGGQGFKTLTRWLADHDVLFLREDRETPLVVMPWRTYERMIKRLTEEKG